MRSLAVWLLLNLVLGNASIGAKRDDTVWCVRVGAPPHSALSYWGADVSGIDGTTLTAGWVAAEADGAAAGAGTGAAAIASVHAAGEGLARGDVRTSDAAALAAGGAPSAAEVG